MDYERTLSGLLILLFAPLAQAEMTGRVGYDVGGDTLLSIQFTNGDTSSIKAGEGAFLEIGYQFPTPTLNNPALNTEITLGYKRDSEAATNGDVSFTRWSVNLQQWIAHPNWRFGAGVNFNLFNVLSTSGSFLGNQQLEFDPAIGLSLMGEYLITDTFAFGIKASAINFDWYQGTESGNSMGLYIGARLP